MTGSVNATKAGLVLGTLLGGWHLCWAILVASGVAQTVIDFVLWIHFIKPIFVIEPFQLTTAAVLVVVTGVLGFIVGAVFAFIWNLLRK